ncbi:MAG: molybdenum ABC transporter ATP-binding protein [Woeseiaceae bacterium]|nr:molybdenum ABC transporter ATP-binding protein [Woeseiaceae bacterium]
MALQHALQRENFSLDVDVRIPSKGITGLFGASGSGKTTLLRCIAGLEKSDDGDALPVHKRGIGYVFQEPQLFPHLDVLENLRFGLKRSASPRLDEQQVVEMLGLENLLQRMPTQLSGGEAQRVAIGAVLLRSPQLILMDEPLASLDRRRKDELLPYLDRLHDELSVPIIYVSHDIDEVSRLCDHLLLIDDGKIVASGELHDVLSRLDVPILYGRNAGTVIQATPERYDADYDLTRFRFSVGELLVPGHYDLNTPNLRLRIAASDVSLCITRPQKTTILNILPADVDDIQPIGPSTDLVRLAVGDEFLLAQVTRLSVTRLDLKKGDPVFAQVKSVTVRR